MRLEDLNALGAEAAERKLLRCCGSLQWATMMVAARPFEDRENWSQQEQAGIAAAAEDVRTRLAAANREYHARFGYIFIVCATGKTAEEMLEILERRLKNAPESELRVAAEEQRKITRLRLAKLLDHEQVPTT